MSWYVRFLMDCYHEGRMRKVGEVFESQDLPSVIDLEKHGIVIRIPKPEKKQEGPPFPVSHFLKMKPNKKFIMEKIFFPGTAVMFYGLPGCMKSTLSLTLATAITNGKEVLGMKTRRGTILYMDAENGMETIRSRIVALKKGLGIRSNQYPLFYHPYGVNLEDFHQLEAIFEFIGQKNVNLVILDTFRSFFSGEENSSGEVNQFFRNFVNPLRERGVCVLLLHHSNKPGTTYRGSSDVAGKVDSFFCMEKKEQGVFMLTCEKARGPEPEKIAGEFTFEEGCISIRAISPDNLENKTREKFHDDIDAIRILFEEPEQEMTLAEIEDGLMGKSYEIAKATLKRRLKWLEKSHFMSKPRKGTYKRLWQ